MAPRVQTLNDALGVLVAVIREEREKDAHVSAGAIRDAYYLGRIHERAGLPLSAEHEAYLDHVAQIAAHNTSAEVEA
jgi:hypothetical protein